MYQLHLTKQRKLSDLSQQDKKLVEYLSSLDTQNMDFGFMLSNQKNKYVLHHAWDNLRTQLKELYEGNNISFACHYVEGGKFTELEQAIQYFEEKAFGFWITEYDRVLANARYWHNYMSNNKKALQYIDNSNWAFQKKMLLQVIFHKNKVEQLLQNQLYV